MPMYCKRHSYMYIQLFFLVSFDVLPRRSSVGLEASLSLFDIASMDPSST